MHTHLRAKLQPRIKATSHLFGRGSEEKGNMLSLLTKSRKSPGSPVLPDMSPAEHSQSTHRAMWPCPGRIVQLVSMGQSGHPNPEQCELMKLLLCTWTSPRAVMARCRWYNTTLHPCQQALPTNFTKLLIKFFPELQNEGKLSFLGALAFRKTSSSTEVIPCVDESWSPIHRNLLCIAVTLSASQLLYYFSRFCLHTLLLFFPYSQAPY